jgi:glycerol-3-phosphate dehydrogenase
MKYDVLIAGAGVIGGMVARELSKYQLSVCLLEKENDVAMGATKANSGIIHGGYDPEPGTLKAEMNTKGVALLYEAVEQLHVPYRKNGSMICAFGKEQESAVYELYERGLKNGISGMKILSGDEARDLEPNLSQEITLVLHVPSAGIVCPYKLTIAAIGNAMDNGVQLKRNFEITAVEKKENFVVTAVSGEQVEGKYFINCAGCYSDRVATMVGDCDYTIIPRSGEYLLLDRAIGDTVSHTIFQVPTKEGKGILVTPTADGNLLTGPTATVVETPENTELTPDGIRTIINLAKKSVPGVNFGQVITSFAGVRSSEKKGDFIIEASKKVENFVQAAAIDSPGLTSSVAIARRVVEILAELGLALENKADWCGEREDGESFRHMSDEQKDAYIKEHPDFGKIICRCEMISEGEIRRAITQNPVALDMDGVKRRTRAGAGRCQGGFCSPYVLKMIAQENGMAVQDVTKKGGKSRMLTGRI